MTNEEIIKKTLLLIMKEKKFRDNYSFDGGFGEDTLWALKKALSLKDKKISDAVKELKDELNNYPKDVFMEISKEELKKINLLLIKELKFPIDRLSAHISRIVENNCKEKIDKIFKKLINSQQKNDASSLSGEHQETRSQIGGRKMRENMPNQADNPADNSSEIQTPKSSKASSVLNVGEGNTEIKHKTANKTDGLEQVKNTTGSSVDNQGCWKSQEYLKELIIARIKQMPDNLRLSIG